MTEFYPPLALWCFSARARIIAGWNSIVRVDHGARGNTIWRFGKSYIQRSGHGAICDARLGRLVIWSDPRTGKPFYIFIAKATGAA